MIIWLFFLPFTCLFVYYFYKFMLFFIYTWYLYSKKRLNIIYTPYYYLLTLYVYGIYYHAFLFLPADFIKKQKQFIVQNVLNTFLPTSFRVPINNVEFTQSTLPFPIENPRYKPNLNCRLEAVLRTPLGKNRTSFPIASDYLLLVQWVCFCRWLWFLLLVLIGYSWWIQDQTDNPPTI